jgi:Flp pilus assembly protein TadB
MTYRLDLEPGRKADQEFFAKARKLSPRYPSADELAERRHKAREGFVARSGLVVFALGLVVALVNRDMSPALFALGGLAVFTATCFYAGNRQYDRQMEEGRLNDIRAADRD